MTEKHYWLAGGAGFIGTHLAKSLLQDGHSVTILDKRLRREWRDAEGLPDLSGASYQHRDITNPLPARVSSLDVLVNLASIPDPAEYMNRPIETLRTSAEGTRRTLELARRSGATYVYASTSEVYGDPEEHPQPEDYRGDVDCFGPRSCYDEGKRYGEALCRAYREEHETDIRVARIFNTYGPGMDDARVVPAFIRQALRGDPLTIHGSGTQTRSFCHIDDMVRGLRALIESDIRDPVNLGNPQEVRIETLADIVLEAVERNPTPGKVRRPRPPDDPNKRRPDISKAREALGWEPKMPLREGIEDTIQKMRDEGE